jgi:hypothetical protein
VRSEADGLKLPATNAAGPAASLTTQPSTKAAVRPPAATHKPASRSALPASQIEMAEMAEPLTGLLSRGDKADYRVTDFTTEEKVTVEEETNGTFLIALANGDLKHDVPSHRLTMLKEGALVSLQKENAKGQKVLHLSKILSLEDNRVVVDVLDKYQPGNDEPLQVHLDCVYGPQIIKGKAVNHCIIPQSEEVTFQCQKVTVTHINPHEDQDPTLTTYDIIDGSGNKTKNVARHQLHHPLLLDIGAPEEPLSPSVRGKGKAKGGKGKSKGGINSGGKGSNHEEEEVASVVGFCAPPSAPTHPGPVKSAQVNRTPEQSATLSWPLFPLA